MGLVLGILACLPRLGLGASSPLSRDELCVFQCFPTMPLSAFVNRPESLSLGSLNRNACSSRYRNKPLRQENRTEVVTRSSQIAPLTYSALARFHHFYRSASLPRSLRISRTLDCETSATGPSDASEHCPNPSAAGASERSRPA